MDLQLFPADGPWAEVTPEATRLADAHELGRLRNVFALQGGASRAKINQVCEFDAGLVRQDFGQAPEVFGWDQITTVHESVTNRYYNGRYDTTNFAYRLTRADGASTTLKAHYRDPDLHSSPAAVAGTPQGRLYAALGRAVCDHVTQRLLPGAVQSLKSGESLTFDDVTIDANGFQQGKHMVPWAMIREVTVDKGWLTVKRADKRRAVYQREVSRIPNFTLFITLVESRRDSARNTRIW
jgi:hypothetical protein